MLERMATTTKTQRIPFTGLGEAGGSVASGPFSARAPSVLELSLVSGKLLLVELGGEACCFSSRKVAGSELVDMVF